MKAQFPTLDEDQAQLINFDPPYCRNPRCLWHFPEKIDHPEPFRPHEVPVIQRYPFISPRFRCRKCKTTFAGSFFTFQYRDRKDDQYEAIFRKMTRGMSGRGIAHELKWDEDTIRRKKKRLARQSLLQWAKDLETIRIEESIAFDGLENFAFSQYEPNNLNHAIGRSSLFVYDFNLSPMNRKGRMTKAQVENRLALEKEHGKFDPKAIEKDSKKVFSRLLGKCQFLTLYTDEHHAYQRAAEGLSFFHVMTSSKLARNFYNPLFAVNHMDLLCRHHLAAFKRETIAFAKNTVAMAESYILRAVEKNYMLSQFTKKQKRNLVANTHSPAMILKIRDKIQTFGEFFRFRYSVHQVKLSGDWLRLFRSSDPSSRRPIRGYVGI